MVSSLKLSKLKVTALPEGLADHAYASWQAALRQVQCSQTRVEGNKAYQYCLGYLQALKDTRLVDERICSSILLDLHQLWQKEGDRIDG